MLHSATLLGDLVGSSSSVLQIRARNWVFVCKPLKKRSLLWESNNNFSVITKGSHKKNTNYVCVEKKNQLDVTECFIALIICSTYFGHIYAHHQELEAICVLLVPMVCDALVAGCWRPGSGQPAMRSEW